MYILQRYEAIQWFDFEYGLYFTSKIGFSIFESKCEARVKILMILSHDRNNLQTECQIHWNFVY